MTEFLGKHLDSASPDLLREMVATFAQALMGAEADALCGAAYGERTEERTNSRNSYRGRGWDTRVGSIDLRVPKLRTGSYFPDWRHAGPKRLAKDVVWTHARGVEGAAALFSAGWGGGRGGAGRGRRRRVAAGRARSRPWADRA